MTYYSITRPNDPQIFNNPYLYADIEDILFDPAAAKVFFQDLLVSRPTEFSAIVRLYIIASSALDLNTVTLTNRQGEAIKLAREAMQHNVHPTRYVASRLHVSPRAVQRLLKRASQRYEPILYASVEKDHVPNNKQIRWYPTKAAISQQLAKTRRECAACSKSIQGRFTLCYECGQRFGFTREEWNTSKRKGEPAPAKWLLPEARRIDAQTRKEAINELFKAHGFSGQDFEESLEQLQYAS